MADVKKIWNDVIAKDLQGHGVKILVKFLTVCPDQQPLFKKFASVPVGSLAENSDVAKLAVTVMTKLGEFINSSNLANDTKALAAGHKTMNITLTNFQKIFPIIAHYASANAGGDKASWMTALNAIGSAIDANQK
ncbi:globin-like [Gigantopelta aegis]|uniref:globin-like n=1 Tax=Gigantopelta aegis TaxID=1735272 RepID=UPI001B88D90B|nr:globin-like [Gigantopelta aegis]